MSKAIFDPVMAGGSDFTGVRKNTLVNGAYNNLRDIYPTAPGFSTNDGAGLAAAEVETFEPEQTDVPGENSQYKAGSMITWVVVVVVFFVLFSAGYGD